MNEKLLEVLAHEGAVTIVTWSESTPPNAVCTWNSYIEVSEKDTLLIPVAGMTTARKNLAVQPELLVMLGSREVEGFNGYQGTGFEIKGKGTIREQGADFDFMKEKYGFMNALLEVEIDSARQLL